MGEWKACDIAACALSQDLNNPISKERFPGCSNAHHTVQSVDTMRDDDSPWGQWVDLSPRTGSPNAEAPLGGSTWTKDPNASSQLYIKPFHGMSSSERDARVAIQLARTESPRVGIQPGAVYQCVGKQYNGDVRYASLAQMNEGLRTAGVPSTSSARGAPVDISATIFDTKGREWASPHLRSPVVPSSQTAQEMHRAAMPHSPDLSTTHQHSTNYSMNVLSSSVPIVSVNGSVTERRAEGTRGTPPYRDGLCATVQPVEGENHQPITVSLTANNSTSKGLSHNISPNVCSLERDIQTDVGEQRLYGTGNGVQADGGSPILGSSCGPVLPTKFEGEIPKLKAKLLEKGADKQVVELCDQVFEDGVTIEALEKRMTAEQCESLGVRDGKQFRRFLDICEGSNGQMTERHRCRLCSPGKLYKNHRDALRHLLKDHFGLGFRCGRW
jgi:hypothetical protein